MYGTRSFFATACEGWVLLTPRKAITKVQDRNRIESDGKKVEYAKTWGMKHELTRTSLTKVPVRVFR